MSRVVVTNETRRRDLPWLRLRIRKSLDDICHTLEMEIPSSHRAAVRKHDLIRVRVENPLISGGRRLVATVRVDEITSDAEANAHRVTVIGRSPARDIIDSTWEGELWSNNDARWTLAGVARRIAGEFDIDVDWFPKGQPDPTACVNFFAWQNESPWAKLIVEADAQGFLITSNEAGGLYIWKAAGTARSEGFHVTEGGNVRTVEWRQNGAEQFHEYVVRGAFAEARVFDPECRTSRVLYIDMVDERVEPEKLRRRAETEMRRRRENRTRVTVSGWGLSDRQIRALPGTANRELFWSPNFLIPVRMPSLGLRDNLLTAEVEHEADAHVMQTTVTLVHREAYL